jgi:HAD superfamily hydrolase (TIGR01484 family)
MTCTLLLFDMDGTIAESGKKIDCRIKTFLETLREEKKFEFKIGIVGGGTFDKITYQLDNFPVDYLFSECGSTFHVFDGNQYKLKIQNIFRNCQSFENCNDIIKHALQFIGKNVINTSGHFIDIRNGLLYISLVGLQATEVERERFMKEEEEKHLRKKLLDELYTIVEKNKATDALHLTIGGNTGIAVYPKEWNKSQVLDQIDTSYFKQIFYFGDKYESNGNDYPLLFHESINGIPVDSVDETFHFLKFLILKKKNAMIGKD